MRSTMLAKRPCEVCFLAWLFGILATYVCLHISLNIDRFLMKHEIWGPHRRGQNFRGKSRLIVYPLLCILGIYKIHRESKLSILIYPRKFYPLLCIPDMKKRNLILYTILYRFHQGGHSFIYFLIDSNIIVTILNTSNSIKSIKCDYMCASFNAFW